MIFKRKLIISSAIFIFFALIFLFAAVFPLFGAIKNNSQELLEQKKIIADRNAQEKNLEEFKQFSAFFDENLKKVENLFIDYNLPVQFIRFLEDNARIGNLLITIVPSAGGSLEENKWSFLSFQVTVFGSFADFLKFLEKLENSLYLVQVQNLNISMDKGGSDKITADLSIRVFAR